MEVQAIVFNTGKKYSQVYAGRRAEEPLLVTIRLLSNLNTEIINLKYFPGIVRSD